MVSVDSHNVLILRDVPNCPKLFDLLPKNWRLLSESFKNLYVVIIMEQIRQH